MCFVNLGATHIKHFVYLYPSPSLRKAKDTLQPSCPKKIDKTIIIEDSLPFGTDNMDTQVCPDMDDLAEQFHAEEVPMPEPPSSDFVAHIGFKNCLIIYYLFCDLGQKSTICCRFLTGPRALTIKNITKHVCMSQVIRRQQLGLK